MVAFDAVHFDDDAAEALIVACRGSAEILSGQEGPRFNAAQAALVDFRGVFADCFRDNAQAERMARVGLVRTLEDLIPQVRAAIDAARRERRRRELEAAARESFAMALAGGVGLDPQIDPRALRTEVDRPRVVAERERQPIRQWAGGTAGVSSADPDALDTTVSAQRLLDDDVRVVRNRMSHAAGAFEDRCSWAVQDLGDVRSGLARYATDNAENWERLANVASAFRAAGGGAGHGPVAVSNVVLAMESAPGSVGPAALLAFLSQATDADLKALQGDPRWQTTLAAALNGMSAENVAAWWAGMNPPTVWGPDGRFQTSAVQAFLLANAAVVLGDRDGVPFAARDVANRTVLRTAIDSVGDRIAAMQRRRAADGSDDETIDALRARLDALTSIQSSLTPAPDANGNSAPRLLVGLDPSGTVTGQVAIGNLDTAQNVTYAIPGINTTGANLKGWVDASQSLYNEAVQVDPSNSQAVVAWLGSPTPQDLEVFLDDKAISAGKALGADLAGFNATRTGEGTGQRSLNVVGLSYGGVTTAEALHAGDYGVDAVVYVAPPGIPADTGHREGIHADHVYAGMGDEQIAGLGRNFSMAYRDDPADPLSGYGATIFDTSAQTGSDGETLHAVNDHAALDGAAAHRNGTYAYFDDKTTSLRNTALAITGQEDRMFIKDPGR